jgi:hypothetical protein
MSHGGDVHTATDSDGTILTVSVQRSIRYQSRYVRTATHFLHTFGAVLVDK